MVEIDLDKFLYSSFEDIEDEELSQVRLGKRERRCHNILFCLSKDLLEILRQKKTIKLTEACKKL